MSNSEKYGGYMPEPDFTTMVFPERIPENDMGKRPSIWPLSDLKDTEDEAIMGEDMGLVKNGAKMAVQDLYEEVNIENLGEIPGVEEVTKTTFDKTSTEARSSVLLTAELLELILSFLSSQDIWQARNVCQSWQDLIMSSPSLRRALWFTLKAPPIAPIRHVAPQQQFTMNPILQSLNLVNSTAYSGFHKLADLNFPARWRTVRAPWREMQICDPPIKVVFLTSSWLDKYLECETGITVGQLADRLELSRVGGLACFHNA